MRKSGRIEPESGGKFAAIIEVQDGTFKQGVLVGGLTEICRQVFDDEESAIRWIRSQGATFEDDALAPN